MVLFVDKVAIIGAGTMGARIAQVFALNGKQVVLKEIDQAPLDTGMATIKQDLDELVAFHEGKGDREIARIEKNGITLTDEQKDQVRKKHRPTYSADRAEKAIAKITPTTDYADLAGCDLVIEAVIERMDVKKAVFDDVAKVVDSRCVFATNTSALSVTEMAKATDRPGRFLGLHFFNPPTTLPLVEVIPAETTEDETLMDVMNVISELRNHRYPMMPVKVQETPGFLVNRILGAMMNEAFLCYEERIAAPRDIDIAMKAGAGFPMGPLELVDRIGLDVAGHVQDTLTPFFIEREKKAATVVSDLVKQGKLGRKSGEGFFRYD